MLVACVRLASTVSSESSTAVHMHTVSVTPAAIVSFARTVGSDGDGLPRTGPRSLRCIVSVCFASTVSSVREDSSAQALCDAGSSCQLCKRCLQETGPLLLATWLRGMHSQSWHIHYSFASLWVVRLWWLILVGSGLSSIPAVGLWWLASAVLIGSAPSARFQQSSNSHRSCPVLGCRCCCCSCRLLLLLPQRSVVAVAVA